MDSSHQPAVLLLQKSGGAEKPTSSVDEVSGPHVVMGSLMEDGGVCKAERAALDAEELYDRPMLL